MYLLVGCDRWAGVPKCRAVRREAAADVALPPGKAGGPLSSLKTHTHAATVPLEATATLELAQSKPCRSKSLLAPLEAMYTLQSDVKHRV